MDTKTLQQTIRNLESGDYGTLRDILLDIAQALSHTQEIVAGIKEEVNNG